MKNKFLVGKLTHYRKDKTAKGIPKVVCTIDTGEGSFNFHDFNPGTWNYESLMMTEVKVYYEPKTHYNNLQAIVPSNKILPLEVMT